MGTDTPNRWASVSANNTLLGPTCLGFINFTTGGVCWTGAMRTPPLKGGISIVSQSGAVATVMKHFAHQHGVGMNVVAATGNEAMLGLAECVDYLVDDESTKVIAVFAETVRDTRLFRAAAERALAKAKPIVVLKVGRSDIATQAAQSHTGSLVGDDSVFDGVFRQLGLVRVRSLEDEFKGLVLKFGMVDVLTCPCPQCCLGCIH